jgi:hypothetical protein
MTLTTRKIYVHLIDGTDVWVPVEAKEIGEDQYEILDNVEYDDLDTSELFEFFPGDIVKLGQRTFSEGKTGAVARDLVKASSRTDRKYWEFMFLATEGRLEINIGTSMSCAG